MRRRPLRLAACGVLMVLAACGGGGGGGGDDASDDRTGPTAVDPSTTTTPPPAASTLPRATEPACPAIPPRAAPAADRPRYVLAVDVDPATGRVKGDLKVAFTPDLPTDELVFRLWPNGPRGALGGVRLETGPVTVDGVEAASTRADATTLVVRPGRTIDPGTTVDVAMTWTLDVPGPADDRISHDQDSMRLGSFFPILPWEPGVGWAREPAVGDFAEASAAPTADFDLTVTVPDGYDVLASGEPVPAGSNHFVAPAMRDVALSIGRFEDLVTAVAHAPDPVQVTVGVHTGVPGSAQAFLDQVVAVLETFGERYGPYPWSTFTLALTPELGGGIEYPSHVMQGPFTLGDITTHEVGHMWFYGLVGNDQGRDPWLDEGLTTWTEAREQGTIDLYTAHEVPRVAKGRLGEPMSFWTLRPLYYQDGVYTQGVQALAALGPPDLVDCALRVYVAQNAHRIATPAHLLAAASAVIPDAPEKLAPFGIEP
ncbi:MAG TPA: hypothetical protein VM942_01415 [Acidimicrobiales bacterium]|nr:hypothetical protein [Acidimicrobiales bacterium]